MQTQPEVKHHASSSTPEAKEHLGRCAGGSWGALLCCWLRAAGAVSDEGLAAAGCQRTRTDQHTAASHRHCCFWLRLTAAAGDLEPGLGWDHTLQERFWTEGLPACCCCYHAAQPTSTPQGGHTAYCWGASPFFAAAGGLQLGAGGLALPSCATQCRLPFSTNPAYHHMAGRGARATLSLAWRGGRWGCCGEGLRSVLLLPAGCRCRGPHSTRPHSRLGPSHSAQLGSGAEAKATHTGTRN